ASTCTSSTKRGLSSLNTASPRSVPNRRTHTEPDQMEGEIVVGTVRAVRNGRHVVVRRDGSTIDVAFDGNASPLIGGDVIGRVTYGDFGEARMTLRKSVLDVILEGKVQIFPMGLRPDLTARALAKLLSRARSAVIAPGEGISIERSPVSSD